MTSGAATGAAVAAAVSAAAGVAVLLERPRRVSDRGSRPGRAGAARGPDLLHRWRAVWTGLAGLAGLTWVDGWRGPALGAVLAVATWWWIGRAEPAGVRRERERARAQLPHLVLLFGAALRAGSAPGPALELVCRALPGAAADRLGTVTSHLSLGGDPGAVWAQLSGDPDLAPLGRCLARAHLTGAPVVDAVSRLSEELAAERRSAAQDRARTVGVRAALPLGLCLLPAFLLLGIVPLVADLAQTLLGP